jgi:mRNA interferase RelE/StbE
MYKVILGSPVRKDLDNLQSAVYQRILAALQDLADNPRPRGCVKLVTGVGEYRLRVGDYRVLYDVDDRDHTVTVLRVKHRSKVYRQ